MAVSVEIVILSLIDSEVDAEAEINIYMVIGIRLFFDS